MTAEGQNEGASIHFVRSSRPSAEPSHLEFGRCPMWWRKPKVTRRKPKVTTLLHGTTRRRAKQIVERGPDLNFFEPGGTKAKSFSTYLKSGPTDYGSPEDYACSKARLFPHEG